MSSAMLWPARRFGSTTCRILAVLGLGLGFLRARARARARVRARARAMARAMWARARVCRTLLFSSRRAH
eukprot:scaffold117006_cov71-Phaeocystis_antarctica.AAC.8